MIPAWPFIVVASFWYMFISPRLFGPYFVVDRFKYKGVDNQVRQTTGLHLSVEALGLSGVRKKRGIRSPEYVDCFRQCRLLLSPGTTKSVEVYWA